MKKELELLAPLVDELQQFCNGLERGGRAGRRSNDRRCRRHLAGGPSIKLEAAEEDQPGPEAHVDLLAVVADVGYVAEALLAEAHPKRTLA